MTVYCKYTVTMMELPESLLREIREFSVENDFIPVAPTEKRKREFMEYYHLQFLEVKHVMTKELYKCVYGELNVAGLSIRLDISNPEAKAEMRRLVIEFGKKLQAKGWLVSLEYY